MIEEGGTMVKCALCLTALYDPVIVAAGEAVTEAVATVKFALCERAGMTTVFPFGKVALELLLLRVTSAPPLGAGPPSETVPVTDVPPVTLMPLSVRRARSGG